jgi:hypothetical protein
MGAEQDEQVTVGRITEARSSIGRGAKSDMSTVEYRIRDVKRL